MKLKATKKPISVYAVQWTGDNLDEIKEFDKDAFFFKQLVIPTLEGNHLAIIGDYIIKGIAGEFYPCKKDIFEKTYDFEKA
jgi:hypothetical protein